MLELRLKEQCNRHYNITGGKLEQRSDHFQQRINIGGADYCEGEEWNWQP